MSAKTPIQDDQNPNDEVIKVGFKDWVGMFFGYLWFMRRALFGIILLAALGYGIYRVWKMPPKTFDDGPRLVGNDTDSSESLTDPGVGSDIDGESGDSSKKSDKPSVRRFKDIVVPKREKFAPYEPLLETGTVDELVEEIFKLRGSWVGKNPSVIFLMNQRRSRVARRLMELEISDSQQVFALSQYIESIVVLDMVASQKRMNAPEVRTALEEIISQYVGHDHPTISSKANLARILIPLHDYAVEQREGLLEEFSTRLEENGDQVFEDPVTTGRLCSVALWLRRVCDWDGTGLPYCVKLIDKMDQSKDLKIRNASIGLRERVFFEHLEILQLVARIDQEDKKVNGDIKEFFQGIESNPDLRLEFYQVAVTVIEKFKSIEKKEEYNSLLAWLTRISTKIGSEDSKSEVESAIRKLESLPWGPRDPVLVEDPLELPDAAEEPEIAK